MKLENLIQISVLISVQVKPIQRCTTKLKSEESSELFEWLSFDSYLTCEIRRFKNITFVWKVIYFL